ncbi:transposase [Streptomyces sp. NBC_01220]|uniref:transposase n=1 Tax=unclassified Streptomyces TaxID=2593676 RepID=UPI00352E7855
MGTARYSEEFKQDAVKLVASTGRSINSVAKDLGVNTESLRQWVRPAEAAPCRHCATCRSSTSPRRRVADRAGDSPTGSRSGTGRAGR